MTPIAEYRAYLIQMGFSEAEADQIVRMRISHAHQEKPGILRAQKTGDGEGEILIYEEIGFDFWNGGGMTPQRLVDELAAMGPLQRLTVRVNSPGGSVFDAFTIYNILRRQEATVAVEVEGLAASAASFVIQAAAPGELRVSEASALMIHRAWAVAMGNFQDMLDRAAVLKKFDGQIADIYAKRSKRKAASWLAAMDAETWYTGQEAVDAKLADALVPAKKVAALVDPAALAGYRNVPAALLARPQAQAPVPPEPGRTIRLEVTQELLDDAAGLPPIVEKAEAEELDLQKAEAERVAVRLRLLELDDLTAPAGVS